MQFKMLAMILTLQITTLTYRRESTRCYETPNSKLLKLPTPERYAER